MLALVLQYILKFKEDIMKNLTSLFVVLCISFATTAGNNRVYKRLDRLYNSNQTKCLKIAKRYIKYFPDTPASYYFASIVYRNKSKVHFELKTRYMMMSKAIGYAMKFEDFENINLETKINWEGYLVELRLNTDNLINEMEVTDLACYGERLALKHEKMVDNRSDIILIASNTNGPPIFISTESQNESPSDAAFSSSEPEVVSTDQGYFGLATGKEIAPFYNKMQEEQLLDLINEQRKELFMSPLKLENMLTKAARYHAYDMATQNYLRKDSHDPINGNLVQVASTEERIGQFYPKNHFLAQNIAGGTKNAIETLNDWMEYDDEYDALFDETSKKVGIGIYYNPSSKFKYYWVLITAKK